MALRGLQATEVFGYDEMQRLRWSKRDWTGTSPPPHEEESYTYDDLGNILSKSNYGSAYAYGSATRACDNAGPHAVKSVRKTDGTTATFTYDLNGNQLDGDGRHLDFDLMDRPVHVCPGPAADCGQAASGSEFSYGPAGSRYLQQLRPAEAKYGPKTVYYVDKDFELWVWAPSATLPSGAVEERSYLSGSVVAYRRDAGPRELRYQSVDRLGSIELVTKDDAAASVDSLDLHGYDAFGKPRGEAWTSSGERLHSAGDLGAASDRGFTGHEHLDAHYLIHMNGRVYDYRLGRFLSVDPIISDPASSQAINPYSYIGNNPLSGSDPTGYIPKYTFGGGAMEIIYNVSTVGVGGTQEPTPGSKTSGSDAATAKAEAPSTSKAGNPEQTARGGAPSRTDGVFEKARKYLSHLLYSGVGGVDASTAKTTTAGRTGSPFPASLPLTAGDWLSKVKLSLPGDGPISLEFRITQALNINGPPKYLDLNFSYGRTLGLSMGIIFNVELGDFHLYVGPAAAWGAAVSLTGSSQSVTPGWNFAAQASAYRGSAQIGFDPSGRVFNEYGWAIIGKGGSVSNTWISPPLSSPASDWHPWDDLVRPWRETVFRDEKR